MTSAVKVAAFRSPDGIRFRLSLPFITNHEPFSNKYMGMVLLTQGFDPPPVAHNAAWLEAVGFGDWKESGQEEVMEEEAVSDDEEMEEEDEEQEEEEEEEEEEAGRRQSPTASIPSSLPDYESEGSGCAFCSPSPS